MKKISEINKGGVDTTMKNTYNNGWKTLIMTVARSLLGSM